MTSEANTDEAFVPNYSLPELLTCLDGSKVESQEGWANKRREEILRLFSEHVYGKTPSEECEVRKEELSKDVEVLSGKAIRKEIRVHFSLNDRKTYMDILIYLPKNRPTPAPLFLGLNFWGNHSISDDPGITLSQRWMRGTPELGIVNDRATEASRGTRSDKWSIEMVLERGYGLATIYCGDLDTDIDDGYENGIHPLFYNQGQTQPKENEWGTIGAWAWGLSRALDIFEGEDMIDASKVAVMGHSRLGKTALWAAAQDERFAMAISNNSGCTGAALSRRRFGETVERINRVFPHWFCNNYRQFNNREEELPIDQHMLISLVAPRPVYVASASEDLHADPKGEFLSCLHAEPAYHLHSLDGLEQSYFPAVEEPIHKGHIGYHLRTGKHSVEPYDWECFLDFADRYLKPV